MEYRNVIGEDVVVIKNFLKEDEIKEYTDLIDEYVDFEEIFKALPGLAYKEAGRFKRLFAAYGPIEIEGNLEIRKIPDALKVIQDKVQAATKEEYNGIFFNKYRSGDDGFGLHTDTAVPNVDAKYFPILSIGGPRDFSTFHPKYGKHTVTLESGDLLLPSVDGFHRQKWLHGILQTTKKVNPRISVVFYNIVKEAVNEQYTI